MPNWVKNVVKFDDKRVIKECYREEDGEETFDFNRVIPRPKSLSLTSGGKQNISIAYAVSKMSEEKKKELKEKLKSKKTSFYGNYYEKFFKSNYKQEDFEEEEEKLKKKIDGTDKDAFDNVDYNGLGIKNLEDLGNTYINNVLEYGFDTWYDWSCENWGTKWNACHTYYIDENNIEFDTAWCTPENIFKEISKKYNTRVVVDFADEDIGNNCGRICYEDGKEVYYLSGNQSFAYDVWGYSEEEVE